MSELRLIEQRHGAGVYDQANDHDTYEMVVTKAPNHRGNYEGHVNVNGRYLSDSYCFSENRDEVIAACRNFADWHRNRDNSTETIPL